MGTSHALDERQQAALVCLRHCPVWEDCRTPPMTCSLRYTFAYAHEPAVVVRRHRARRGNWLQRLWRDDPGAVVGYAVALASIGYFTWHLLAAIAEGRLPLPGLR